MKPQSSTKGTNCFTTLLEPFCEAKLRAQWLCAKGQPPSWPFVYAPPAPTKIRRVLRARINETGRSWCGCRGLRNSLALGRRRCRRFRVKRRQLADVCKSCQREFRVRRKYDFSPGLPTPLSRKAHSSIVMPLLQSSSLRLSRPPQNRRLSSCYFRRPSSSVCILFPVRGSMQLNSKQICSSAVRSR